MVAHYEVKSYETLKAYLADNGIKLPAEKIANQIVWGYYLHYWSPWLAYGFHLIKQKYKYGMVA
jgi:hypothetical protein